jgi:hypothetical protein
MGSSVTTIRTCSPDGKNSTAIVPERLGRFDGDPELGFSLEPSQHSGGALLLRTGSQQLNLFLVALEGIENSTEVLGGVRN